MLKKLLLISVVTATGAFAYVPKVDLPGMGWKAPRVGQERPVWAEGPSQMPSEWVGTGKGKVRLLYQDYYQLYGHTYVPRHQGKAPSCVGVSMAAGIDILAAVEIMAGEAESQPPAPASGEAIYGLSRVEIRGGVPFPGSNVDWACEAVKQYGVVFNLNYGLLGHDLRVYSPERAVEYGRTGLPDELEYVARLHPVRDYIKINNFHQLRDAIHNGCPVVVGSNIGFGEPMPLTRDEDGFLNRPRNAPDWAHAMVFIGACDYGRKGALILNSWGDEWVEGPKRFGDEPDGSFWADVEVVEQMIARGDCYALRGFSGFSNYIIW